MGFIICARRVSRCVKENILEDLKGELLKYKIAGEFLVEIKKEFRREDEKTVKVAKLKRLKQKGKTMSLYKNLGEQ